MATVLLVPHSETFLVFEQQEQVLHFIKLFVLQTVAKLYIFSRVWNDKSLTIWREILLLFTQTNGHFRNGDHSV